MQAENRRSPRIPKELSATAERVATGLHSGETRFFPVRIVDVSRDGIGFMSPEAIDRDAFVRLTISMSMADGMAATGRLFITSVSVRNCARHKDGGYQVHARYRVGASLKEQTPQEHEGWHELVRKWSPQIT